MRIFQIVPLIGFFGLAAALGGCGDGGSSTSNTTADARGVIASASDCVSFGDEAVKACAAAIERAVASHEASSQLFSNIEDCAKTAGNNKCERAASGKYRAKLSAFLVTIGSSTAAEPLYPTKDGEVGFQTASKSKLLASDRSLSFSRLALSVAESQADTGKRKRAKL